MSDSRGNTVEVLSDFVTIADVQNCKKYDRQKNFKRYIVLMFVMSFCKKFSTTKHFSSRFPSIFSNIFQRTIIPLYSICGLQKRWHHPAHSAVSLVDTQSVSTRMWQWTWRTRNPSTLVRCVAIGLRLSTFNWFCFTYELTLERGRSPAGTAPTELREKPCWGFIPLGSIRNLQVRAAETAKSISCLLENGQLAMQALQETLRFPMMTEMKAVLCVESPESS